MEKKVIFLFLTILACSTFCFGQYLYEGQVRAENGSIKWLEIRLIDEKEEVWVQHTDANGIYHFDLPHTGRYLLEFKADGYKEVKVRKVIPIKGGKSQQAEIFELSPEKKIVLQIPNSYFFPEEAELTQYGKEELNKLGDVLKAIPEMFIELQAADPNERKNELEQMKVQLVKKYFTLIGVDKKRISSNTKGN